MKKSLFAIAMSATFVLPMAADAASSGVKTDYVLRLGNIKFAKAHFDAKLDGERFDISGNYATSGLVRVVKKASGNARASGKVKGNSFSPEVFHLDYKNGGPQKSLNIAFNDGRVTEVKQTPARTNYPDSWVALTEGDLSHAVDPLTALFHPATGRACEGTIPLFDGEARMDLALKRKGSANMRIKGKLYEVEVCRVNFDLKSGYKKGSSDLEKIEQRQGIEVWFAKSPNGDIYAPVRISVPTKIGTVTVRATRFGA